MLPRFNISRTAFFLCDIQEKLIPSIKESAKVIAVAKRMLDAAEILNIPVIVTEQYSKGLGSTVSELRVRDHSQCRVFEKTQFSMMTPEVRTHLRSLNSLENIVIFGLEAHVCVYQSVKDLLDVNYKVFLAVDGVASRSLDDQSVALAQLARFGAVMSTSESILFELCSDAKHDKFKQISQLIKQKISTE